MIESFQAREEKKKKKTEIFFFKVVHTSENQLSPLKSFHNKTATKFCPLIPCSWEWGF